MSTEVDIITTGREFLGPGQNTVTTFDLGPLGVDNHHWVKACAFPIFEGEVRIVFENYIVNRDGNAQYIVEFVNPGPNDVAFEPKLMVSPNR